MRQAMNNVVLPMEHREMPWAVTFGNHDEDSTPESGLDETDMLAFYRSYAHNLNKPSARRRSPARQHQPDHQGRERQRPAFNLLLLDSGRYAPEKIAGQDFEGYPTWDWIRMNQVQWYTETSRRVERQAGHVVPSLMFIHIPLWEYRFMWFASVDSRTDADHQRGGEEAQDRSGSGTRTSAPARSTRACSRRSWTAATSRASSAAMIT